MRKPKSRAKFAAFSVLAVATAGLFAVLIMRSMETYRCYFGQYHDDAIYLVTARALAEGRGFKIISLPGEPAQTKYPIGFPLMHALVWKLFPNFPDNLQPIVLIQSAIGAAAAVVVAAYLVRTRKVTPLLGLVICSATVLNYHYIDFSAMVMSDLACMLLAIIALWRAEVEVRGQARWYSALLLGCLLALPALMRTQGIITIPTTFIFLCVRKKVRLAFLSMLVALVIVGPQLAWQLLAQRSQDPFLTFYTSYLGHAYGTLPAAEELPEQAFENYRWSGILQINMYFPFLARLQFEPMSPAAFALLFNVGYFLLGIPLMLGSFLEFVRFSLPGLYCFFYSAMLAGWPLKAEYRHVLPQLALNYYFYYRGFRWFGKVCKPRKTPARKVYQKLCAVASIVLATYLIGGTALEAMQDAGRYGRAFATMGPWARGPRRHAADYAETFAWIKANTRPSDTFVCNNDPLLFLGTDRKAIFPSKLEMWRFSSSRLIDSDSMLDAIRFAKASYVVNDPVYRTEGVARRHAAQAILTITMLHPGLLTPVFRSRFGSIMIFAVDPQKLPPIDEQTSGGNRPAQSTQLRDK